MTPPTSAPTEAPQAPSLTDEQRRNVDQKVADIVRHLPSSAGLLPNLKSRLETAQAYRKRHLNSVKIARAALEKHPNDPDWKSTLERLTDPATSNTLILDCNCGECISLTQTPSADPNYIRQLKSRIKKLESEPPDHHLAQIEENYRLALETIPDFCRPGNPDHLTWTIPNLKLHDVPLGDIHVRMHLQHWFHVRLHSSQCGPENPHPNASSIGQLCLGDDGNMLVKTFQQQHDLLAAIDTINAVIHTYGSQNPYLPLSEWAENEVDRRRNLCVCDCCEEEFHRNQTVNSPNGNILCDECAVHCSFCSEPYASYQMTDFQSFNACPYCTPLVKPCVVSDCDNQTINISQICPYCQTARRIRLCHSCQLPYTFDRQTQSPDCPECLMHQPQPPPN